MSIATTLEDCLRKKGSEYDVVQHRHTHNSAETAEAAHIPGDRLAKTVLLEDERGYVAAVLPATHRLQLAKLWAQTGRRLVLARETDLPALFKDCDVGAIPPVCAAYGLPTYVDQSLAGQADVYFEAGDHEALIHMRTQQFMDLMEQAETARFSRRRPAYRH
ncbi:prolyl-tRNA synthetase [Pandoraea thiooxydans]|uniref:Deacylase n=1 Tax=Pandoraea thiooxydans TaxID=445709 RepID=A0A0G3ETN7_9BURK|nr:YbaK/EbsC family protein [Pandoraea thiooxydans]AKJ68061.1 deacylase [Pandoraea thiooxydans]APR95312.1 prolyl-tRNA synthetase [Pandoraea thiooxydans]